MYASGNLPDTLVRICQPARHSCLLLLTPFKPPQKNLDAVSLLSPHCLLINRYFEIFVFFACTAEISKQISPEKELRSHGSNFHIHVPVNAIYTCRPILGIYESLTGT